MTVHLALFSQKFCDVAKITRETECGLAVASLPVGDSVVVEDINSGSLPKYDCEACRRADEAGRRAVDETLARHGRKP